MLAVTDLAAHVGMEAPAGLSPSTLGTCTAIEPSAAGVFSRHASCRCGRGRRWPSPSPSRTICSACSTANALPTRRRPTVYATLLDEGHYHGSVRTMYRLLAAQGQAGERRRQRRHPVYTKPELLAMRPNEVWSWDITKFKGPAKWTCFHLYVILDIFSRYVVGWMIAHRETAELAEQLIADTIDKQNIAPGTLTLHADRGTSMRSKPVAAIACRSRCHQNPQPPARLG